MKSPGQIGAEYVEATARAATATVRLCLMSLSVHEYSEADFAKAKFDEETAGEARKAAEVAFIAVMEGARQALKAAIEGKAAS